VFEAIRQGRTRRWVLGGVVVLFLYFLLADVLDPFGENEYIAVPHGDHVHYVPHDRDPAVPLSAFPRQAPEPGEQILPDGRVVPKPTD